MFSVFHGPIQLVSHQLHVQTTVIRASDDFWMLRCRKIARPHVQVKMHKTHQVRTTFGSWDVEKVHAVVARSMFRSQNIKNTTCSDHFWFRVAGARNCQPCPKSAKMWGFFLHFQQRIYVNSMVIRRLFHGLHLNKGHLHRIFHYIPTINIITYGIVSKPGVFWNLPKSCYRLFFFNILVFWGRYCIGSASCKPSWMKGRRSFYCPRY